PESLLNGYNDVSAFPIREDHHIAFAFIHSDEHCSRVHRTVKGRDDQLHWICFIRFLALAIAASMSPSKIAVRTISIHGLESSFDISKKWKVQGVWAMARASAVLVSRGSSAKYLF